MKTTDLSTENKKILQERKIATLIGALQAPAAYFSILLIVLILALLRVGSSRYLLAVLGAILTIIILLTTTCFTIKKLNFHHPYKIVAIATVIFYILTIVAIGLISQFKFIDETSSIGFLTILIVETILGAASYLISYSIIKNYGKAK